ncbi:serine hydrolase domain-containing protein [Mucilaginibacter sp. RCC_168]|uniref:serine hydrolase domain-containing protein n=1 Tax=Mucilaginibacter sp. RCC_168 TaxID=3239221 RepID=UPI003524E582
MKNNNFKVYTPSKENFIEIIHWSVKIGLLICFLSVSSYSLAQQDHRTFPEVGSQLDQYLNSAVTANAFNGSVLVAKKGHIILKKGYGWKNYSKHTLNDENTIFQIASLTKSFTATLIMKLQDEGKLSVNDKVTKYFPAFPQWHKISIKNLLDHTSGLYDFAQDIGPEDSLLVSHPVTQNYILHKFTNKPPAFKPGAKFRYSNSNYYLLGMIIEKLTGKSYEKVVRETIFKPFHMDHSGFDFIHLKSPLKATGYQKLNGEIQKKAFYVDSTIYFSAGGIYSTVGDLYQWTKVLAEKSILTQKSWKTMLTKNLGNYGFGWWVDTLSKKAVIRHSGGLIGFKSYITYFPDQDVTIIILNNVGDYQESLDNLNNDLAAIVFNNHYSLWKTPKEVKLDNDAAKYFVGTYTLNDQDEIVITKKDGHLNVSSRDNKFPTLILYAQSRNVFFQKTYGSIFKFITGANGRVDHLTIFEHGKYYSWKKVK